MPEFIFPLLISGEKNFSSPSQFRSQSRRHSNASKCRPAFVVGDDDERTDGAIKRFYLKNVNKNKSREVSRRVYAFGIAVAEHIPLIFIHKHSRGRPLAVLITTFYYFGRYLLFYRILLHNFYGLGNYLRKGIMIRILTPNKTFYKLLFSLVSGFFGWLCK